MAGLVIPAYAQDVLTLDAAVAEALARNAGLAAARAAEQETSARVDQSRSRFFPRVTAVEGWQRGDAPVFVFSSVLASRRFTAANFAIDSLNDPDAVGFFHAGFTVEQLVFDGGRTKGDIETSRGLEASARAARAGHELELSMQVASAYGRLLTAEAAHRAAESAAAAAVEDVARAERRREAGRVTSADVLSLQVHLAAMRQRAIEAAGDAAVARAEINRLRGAPVETAFAVQEPAPAGAAAARDVSALTVEALQNRPDLEHADAELAVAAAGRRQARSAWWPQVTAQASYQFDGLSFADRAASWVIGSEIRWTFSTGLGDRAASRAAVAAEQRARASKADARAAVEVDVLSAVRRLESAEARESVARATVAQARESQRILRDRYEAGMAAVQDVLGAAAAVLEAERLRVRALADRVVAQADLDRAIGRRQ
jgi:outer membrane protein TolC